MVESTEDRLDGPASEVGRVDRDRLGDGRRNRSQAESVASATASSRSCRERIVRKAWIPSVVWAASPRTNGSSFFNPSRSTGITSLGSSVSS